LVDDYSNNLKLWQEKGWIAIRFSDNNKQSDDFVTITKLDQILNIDFYKSKELNKVKVKK
jgi:hypothetical protein